ncbi:hypothetical protein BW731_04315 [Vagococcus martis]|uniref:Dienelactone hydrolase domain-containing protein n=2 Tax=Vagococcus martis TaxID=1768210 RepID=A0A1V4DG86_9ENTE|nr:hypothetical protein BW731_04315 [Vagococcus martis]
MATDGNYIFILDKKVSREHVSFKNRFGIRLSADLYYDKKLDLSKEHAAIVIGSPYGGVKEQGPGIYANELAKRGFIILTFDPSFNGYSGGEIRHISSPDLFVEDFSACVDFLGTRSFVDRNKIGAIGICGSGGFALSAAQVDRRIKAVATVSMYDISTAQRGSEMLEEERNSRLDDMAEQRYIDFEQGYQTLGPRGAAIGFTDETDPISKEFGEFYSTPRGYHPNATTQFSITSSFSFMNFPLLSYIKSISPRPILFIMGSKAHSCAFSETAYDLANEPKELFVVAEANHVDLYDKVEMIPFGKLVSFFTNYL